MPSKKQQSSKKKQRPLVWLLIALVASLLIYFITLPDPASLRTEMPKRTAFMNLRIDEARDNHRAFHLVNTPVPLRSISPLARAAVLLSEDASFYEHDGFDFDEMEAAAREALLKHRLRGASTISQQLAKNLYFSPSRNPLRKIAEAYETKRIEDALDKNRILELYMNLVEWGDGIFGIEAAARHYYNESAFELSPDQAVLLAAMLPMPLKQDPRKPSHWLRRRALRLLQELKNTGHISDAEFLEARGAITQT